MVLSVVLIDDDRSLSISIIDRIQNFAIACNILIYFTIFENQPSKNFFPNPFKWL